MDLPRFFEISQRLDPRAVADVPAAVRAGFESRDFSSRIKPGQSVALAVASRGTHDLVDLVAASVECLKGLGLRPFIVPAMGSHGGGTGPGQANVLADLGITEERVKAEVRATMEVVSLGRIESGAEVLFAADALAADRIMVINRVKPHTAFRSEVESGLCKIMAVGLGRQKGAANMHKYALDKTIVPAARLIMERAPILCGLAVTENALGGTRTIRLAWPEEFVEVDRELLKEAWTMLPRLPMDDLDLLLVDRMGKDISGAGIDPNVIGFWRREGGAREPDYRILAVLDLTKSSHGNATGIGMVDLTTRRFMGQVDLEATRLNALTSGLLRSVRIPLALEDDRAVIETALSLTPDPEQARLARIASTADLETFWVTDPVRAELENRPGIEVGPDPLALSFDPDNRLLPMGDR